MGQGLGIRGRQVGMIIPESRTTRMTVLALVLLTLLFSGLYIHRTSFLVGGKRTFCLFDDAMVSMRYARNLVEGHGLVMNPGERVEGISNPLWTGFMAVAHLLPIPESRVSLVIQVAGAILLALAVLAARRLALEFGGGDERIGIPAAVLTATYLPLVNWSLTGMEVALLAFLVPASAVTSLRAAREQRPAAASWIILGVAVLVRIDMVVPLFATWLYLHLAGPRSLRMRNAAGAALVLLLCLGGQTVARALYYGDVLPNTYYLKMTGYPLLLRLARGGIVLTRFLIDLVPVAPLAAALVVVLSRIPGRGLLGLLVGMQMLYSVWVGGDAWETLGGANRYVVVAMPVFFVLLATALARVADRIDLLRSKRRGAPVRVRRWALPAAALLTILSILAMNRNPGPLGLGGYLLFEPPPTVNDNAMNVRRGLLARRITSPDATIGVTWAGATPYFAHRRTFDFHGKTDPRVARLPMIRAPAGADPLRWFLPGHQKLDYGYSIGALRPDLVLSVWWSLGDPGKYLKDAYRSVTVDGIPFYVRNGSPRVRIP